MLRVCLTSVMAIALLGPGMGCRHFRKNCCDDRPPRGSYLNDPLPPPTLPPQGVPTTPQDDSFPPSSVPDSRSNFRPPSELLLPPERPAPGPSAPLPGSASPPGKTPPPASIPDRELILPETSSSGSSKKPSGYLGEPLKTETRPTTPSESARPSQIGDTPPRALPATPAGKQPADFRNVPDHANLSSGRVPGADGLTWLKANNFKSLIYLHASGADVATLRDQTEKTGLKFVPILVEPASINTAFEEFRSATNDTSLTPAYVCDTDGLRTGSLWYLLFRRVDFLGDDLARLRADPLGLKEAKTEEQKQFWLAIQDYLSKS